MPWEEGEALEAAFKLKMSVCIFHEQGPKIFIDSEIYVPNDHKLSWEIQGSALRVPRDDCEGN